VVEARIICLVPSIRIPDLDLTLAKDQEAYVDEKAAKGSLDLDVARRAGGVQLHWVERSRIVKSPDPPVPPVRVDPPKRGFQSFPAERLELDLDDLASRVAERMVSKTRDSETNSKIDALLELVGNLRQEIAGASVASGQSRGRVTVEDDTPVFIPGKLVNEDLGTVEVKTDDSDSGDGLDKAAEVLKALRKRKKK